MRIDGTMVGDVWPAVEEQLVRAFATTKKLDNADAMALCMAEECELWIALAGETVMGAAITHLEEYSNGYKVITFLAMAGDDLRGWDRVLIDKVEEFGRENGCDAIEIQGRKGWGKWFPEFEPTSWYYAKEL